MKKAIMIFLSLIVTFNLQAQCLPAIQLTHSLNEHQLSLEDLLIITPELPSYRINGKGYHRVTLVKGALDEQPLKTQSVSSENANTFQYHRNCFIEIRLVSDNAGVCDYQLTMKSSYKDEQNNQKIEENHFLITLKEGMAPENHSAKESKIKTSERELPLYARANTLWGSRFSIDTDF